MNNETLALLFCTLLSERDRTIIEKFAEAGIDATLIEIPAASIQAHFEFLEMERESDDPWMPLPEPPKED